MRSIDFDEQNGKSSSSDVDRSTYDYDRAKSSKKGKCLCDTVLPHYLIHHFETTFLFLDISKNANSVASRYMRMARIHAVVADFLKKIMMAIAYNEIICYSHKWFFSAVPISTDQITTSAL
jgi:hypothetical protein